MTSTPLDVDEYLSTLSDEPRATLQQIRQIVISAAPDAVESISYGMPAYKYRGRPLIYFAAARKHCALYGTVEGTIRFPHNEPPPSSRLKALLSAKIAAIDDAALSKGTKPGASASG